MSALETTCIGRAIAITVAFVKRKEARQRFVRHMRAKTPSREKTQALPKFLFRAEFAPRVSCAGLYLQTIWHDSLLTRVAFTRVSVGGFRGAASVAPLGFAIVESVSTLNFLVGPNSASRWLALIPFTSKRSVPPTLRLHECRQPHFVIHKRLLENEAGALLQVRQQGRHPIFHVSGKNRLPARATSVRFPRSTQMNSGEFFFCTHFFNQLVRFEILDSARNRRPVRLAPRKAFPVAELTKLAGAPGISQSPVHLFRRFFPSSLAFSSFASSWRSVFWCFLDAFLCLFRFFLFLVPRRSAVCRLSLTQP